MKKFLSKTFLKEHGWSFMEVGKHFVSYCETCHAQMVHHCTGVKKVNGATIYRFECDTCLERLQGNGGNGHGKDYIPQQQFRNH
jgi:hypothetical protein